MIKYNFQYPRFDEKAFLKSVERQTKRRRDQAAKKYLRAVFNRIPQWSSASAASLMPLAAYVKLTGLRSRLRPRAFPGTHFSREDSNHGIAAGILSGNENSEISNTLPLISFTFGTDIFQFHLFEEQEWDQWHALESGRDAVKEFNSSKSNQYSTDIWRYLKTRKRF